MQNAEGEQIDLYIPRKCSWSNRLIEAKDHASVQINVGHLDQTGVYNGQYTVLALSGYVRNMVRGRARYLAAGGAAVWWCAAGVARRWGALAGVRD
jgi:small subunit ribosomal protein S21e